ncbi:MAG: 4Fe-4S binding protein [Oscillospiraceae bacterium]
MSWNNGIAAIDQSVCVGCGLCAKTCPQQVIAIIPQSAKTAVLCSNHDKGAVTRKACSAGCIGCMKCVKTCEHDAVHVEGNLASVDYEKCVGCGACAQACPTGALHDLVSERTGTGLLKFLDCDTAPISALQRWGFFLSYGNSAGFLSLQNQGKWRMIGKKDGKGGAV